MSHSLKRVLIMAGGTGGHVFPGLAVAEYFRSQGLEVAWLGTTAGLEAKVVPAANIVLHTIPVKGLRGKGWMSLLQAPWRISYATLRAALVIHRFKPDVVIGLGGFVSGPGGFAAWLLRRKLIIHEQNAIAGLTNKMLSHLAVKVLAAFPGAFKASPKLMVVGNPVRASIEALPPPQTREIGQRKPWRLLVLGGSLGAQAMNEVVPQVIAQMEQGARPDILHQSGNRQFSLTQSAYHQVKVNANVQPFIQDMAAAYAWADVVLCRAGALTVSELCAAGLGAILVPYPFAVDDHQTANADFMVQAQAAVCIQQAALEVTAVRQLLETMQHTSGQFQAMAQAAWQLRQTGVAAKIFAICQEVFP